jgi:SNF2 family DNA or RNA helicase
MSYQVYTVRQADRRTWRIGQTNQVNIYYLYYADSFQAEIASLMATKVIASQAIEGEMDSKGLDAISSTRTPEEELAKKFFEHMNLT